MSNDIETEMNAWRCERCGTVYDTNVLDCPDCGAQVRPTHVDHGATPAAPPSAMGSGSDPETKTAVTGALEYEVRYETAAGNFLETTNDPAANFLRELEAFAAHVRRWQAEGYVWELDSFGLWIAPVGGRVPDTCPPSEGTDAPTTTADPSGGGPEGRSPIKNNPHQPSSAVDGATGPYVTEHGFRVEFDAETKRWEVIWPDGVLDATSFYDDGEVDAQEHADLLDHAFDAGKSSAATSSSEREAVQRIDSEFFFALRGIEDPYWRVYRKDNPENKVVTYFEAKALRRGLAKMDAAQTDFPPPAEETA